MSTYQATVHWTRKPDEAFIDNRYSRGHQWCFDGGLTVSASSAPLVVPLPFSVAENIDPEEALVAALSSCHMLFFLAFAAKDGWLVNDYRDQAEGLMEKNAAGKIAMTRVTLRPEVTFDGHSPSRAQLEELHHRSHEHCYIANSVTAEVITAF